MTAPEATPPAPPRARRSYWFTTALVAALVTAAGGYYAYARYGAAQVGPADELQALRQLIAAQAPLRTMDPRYRDADGDLVADHADPIDPAELRFVGIPGDFADDPDGGRAVWADWLAHLAKATGRPVVLAADVRTTEDQAAALRDGRLHVTAFSTGQVTGAVNAAGFVPLACPADAAGGFGYRMEIVVRADSPVHTPADLRGRDVAFSSMSSNSGSRAPMVVLRRDHGLLPGRDYRFTFAGDQVRGVTELAAGRHDAVCVAGDLFARTVADPARGLAADRFRAVYKSGTFPPICYGASHRLPPELVAKVKTALTTFPLPGSSVAKKHREARFAAVDYRRDWAVVRETDEAFGRLLDADRP